MKLKMNVKLNLKEKIKLKRKLNKKLIIILLLIIIAALVLGMKFFMGFDKPFPKISEKPETAVSSFFDAAKEFDYEKMAAYVDAKNKQTIDNLEEIYLSYDNDNNVGKHFKDYLTQSAAKLTYQITATTISDNTATVTVSCKYINGSSILIDVIQEYIDKALETSLAGTELSTEQMNSMILGIVEEKKASIEGASEETSEESPEETSKESSGKSPEESHEKISEEKSEESGEKSSEEASASKDNSEDIYIEKTFDIKLVKIEGQWKIDIVSDDMVRAITANISSGTTKSMLTEIDNFITTEIWYLGFREIAYYIKQGTNSNGQSLDIDKTLAQLGQAILKKAEYNTYISDLDDANYAAVKGSWSALSSEIDVLYHYLITNKPAARDKTANLDISKFKEYQWAFAEAVSGIE